jgi:hypothetical protein
VGGVDYTAVGLARKRACKRLVQDHQLLEKFETIHNSLLELSTGTICPHSSGSSILRAPILWPL